MPELPEVETVKKSLENLITGLIVTEVDLFMPKIIKLPSPQSFIGTLADKTIKRLGRRGKYLLIYLDDNQTMVIHLRMTGRLVYSEPLTPPAKYTHAIFRLSNGFSLFFADMRQFGRLALVDTDQLDEWPGLRILGAEPLSDSFTREYLKKELKRRTMQKLFRLS